MQGSIKYVDGKIYLEEVGQECTSVRYQLKEVLHSKQSPYQLVEIADSYDYGRMLILDGCVNVCERDEANYHEMIAHIPALLHPKPQSVLVIGGGDGGTVRELLKHDSVHSIDVVEIDEEVINSCKKYFPDLASGFNDSRVQLHCEDGVAFVQRARMSQYSVVIVDSSDPIGPAEGLFTKEFYEACRRVLDDNGIIIAQSESPYVYPNVLRQICTIFSDIFPVAVPYRIVMPTYPSGQIYMMMGTMDKHMTKSFENSRTDNFFAIHSDSLHYLTPDMLKSAFNIPGDMIRLLEREEI